MKLKLKRCVSPIVDHTAPLLVTNIQIKVSGLTPFISKNTGQYKQVLKYVSRELFGWD